MNEQTYVETSECSTWSVDTNPPVLPGPAFGLASLRSAPGALRVARVSGRGRE